MLDPFYPTLRPAAHSDAYAGHDPDYPVRNYTHAYCHPRRSGAVVLAWP